MPQMFNRLFNIRAGERGLVITLGCILLGNALTQKIAEIVAVSNFVSEVGAAPFLIVLIISSLVNLLIIGAQPLWVDRCDRIKLLRSLGVVFGVVFISLRLLLLFHAPRWLTYGLLYIISEQQLVFFPVAFWLLANAMFDTPQSKRLFPVLGSLGFVGNLLGLGVAALSPALLTQVGIQPAEILLVNSVIYLLICSALAMGLQGVRLRKTPQKLEPLQAALLEGWAFVREVPAFQYLAISVLGVGICATAIDYHFFVQAVAAFPTTYGFQVFFSLFTLLRILLYILFQSLVTQRLIQRFGIKNAFWVQPISSCLGALSMMALPGLAGGVSGVLFQKIPQYTVDETARKTLQGFVPGEQRRQVSLFIDGYLVSAGVIIGALITGAVVGVSRFLDLTHYFYVYLTVGAIAAAVAIWAIAQMRSVYDHSLLSQRFKPRQQGSPGLDKLDF